MTTHYIKLKEQFCEAVYFGDKPFEICKNDRCYQKGDHIKFIPVTEFSKGLPIMLPIYDPVQEKEYEITYVFSGWVVPQDYVVLGIKEVQTEDV